MRVPPVFAIRSVACGVGPRSISTASELRDLGYYGMMISYHEHVAPAHEIFTPTPAEVQYWKELVVLGDEAALTGVGPILHGDPGQGEAHVVHGAHIESARLNLEWATALGVA
jgi:citrate lyase beta subunit